MSTTAVKASPTARRMAEALGVDLTSVPGTGPGGRVIKEDVEAAAGGAPPGAAASPSATAASASPGAPAPAPDSAPALASAAPGASARVQPLNPVQKVVARRMSESRTSVPEFELHVVVDMQRAVELRTTLKAAAREDEPVPSINDMVVRAAALALRHHPRVNGSYGEAGFTLHEQVNVGIAIAGPDSLMVPVVADADLLALSALGRRTRELAARSREGRLGPTDLEGGTFTVSNLGMLGVRSFSAVINVPQAAILAVGALERRPIVDGDAVVPRPLMDLSLCCDHRIVYGADAAAFLAELRGNLEVPERLI